MRQIAAAEFSGALILAKSAYSWAETKSVDKRDKN
jgi:hypothetical protein